jgi:uncharacterized coiled-coil DUF342 family protein
MDARQIFELEMKSRDCLSDLKSAIEELPSFKQQKDALIYSISQLNEQLQELNESITNKKHK